jgi:DNA helicase-2/ATP-dependent DNA helicase PcrA
MAVLYRAHNNRLEIELELTQRGIPFIVRGGLRFFEQAHIKDLLSYLVVLTNTRDELAWQRMLDMCNRVGPKTISKVLGELRGASDDEGGPLGRFTSNGIAGKQRGQAKQSLTELKDFLGGLEQQREALPVSEIIQQVHERRYAEYMRTRFENYMDRQRDIDELIVFAGKFETLEGFLAEVGLNGSFAGANITGPQTEVDREEGAVTLSTIHQSKGLEWTAVFVVHVQDDVLPHRMTRDDAEQEDEERRLLYVAVTRAKEILYMSYPQMTQTRDFQRLIMRPSRFLDGLPGECYDQATLDLEE